MWSEKNYQNLERECLVTIWAMEKFHYFLYGKEFSLETDQEPLVSIYMKHMVKISPRIQRLVVRSFPYQPFHVRYRKCVEIPLADALSRVTPLPMEEDRIQLPIIAVNQVTVNIPCSSNDLDQTMWRQGRILQSSFWYITFQMDGLVTKGSFHKSSIHIRTSGKISLLKMGLQLRVPEFLCLPHFEGKPWNKSMKVTKEWKSACWRQKSQCFGQGLVMTPRRLWKSVEFASQLPELPSLLETH